MVGVIDPVTGLTHLQEAYAQLLAAGTPEVDAYPQAGYDCSRSTTKSVYELASRLAHDVKVASRVQALRAKLALKHGWDLDRVVLEAEANLALARTGGFRGASAANGSVELIARVQGILSDRPRVELPPIITRITVVLNHGRDAEGREQVTETSYKVLEPGLEVVPSMENPQQTRETPENVQG